jgi:hypothetical protein
VAIVRGEQRALRFAGAERRAEQGPFEHVRPSRDASAFFSHPPPARNLGLDRHAPCATVGIGKAFR